MADEGTLSGGYYTLQGVKLEVQRNMVNIDDLIEHLVLTSDENAGRSLQTLYMSFLEQDGKGNPEDSGYVKVADLEAIEHGAPPSPMAQQKASNVQSASKTFSNAVADIQHGVMKLKVQDDFLTFLQRLDSKVISRAEFNRTPHKKDLAVDFAETNAVVDGLNLETDYAKGTTMLMDLMKILRRQATETMKVAYLIGKLSLFMRAGDGRSWAEVKDTFDYSVSTLRSYEKFYEFCRDYPRFLRTQTNYTALLKYSKPLREFFETHTTIANYWADETDADEPESAGENSTPPVSPQPQGEGPLVPYDEMLGDL